MNPLQAFLKNVVALGTGQAIYRLGLIGLEILLARRLPQSTFGEFATALGFAGIFLVAVDLGINYGLVRVIAQREPDAAAYFGGSLALRGGMALLAFPAMVLVAHRLYPPHTVLLVALLGMFLILSSMQEVLASVYQAVEEMEWIAVFRLALIGATAAGVWYALSADRSLTAVAASYPVVAAAGFALWLLMTARRLPPRLDRRVLRRVASETVLYGVMYVCSVLTFRLGVVVVSFFRPAPEVASFQAAYRFLELASKVPLVLSMALIPIMFRSAQEDPRRLDRLFAIQVRVIGTAILPVAVAVAIFAPEIMTAVYGERYVDAGPLLRLFAVALPLSFLTGALGDTLTARDLQKKRTRIYLAVVAVGLAANLVLAWVWGAMGAALAFVLTQTLLFGLLAAAVGRGVASMGPVLRLYRPLLAVGLAAGVALAGRGLVSAAALAVAFAAVYVLLCLALRAVEVEEIRRVSARLLQRRRT